MGSTAKITVTAIVVEDPAPRELFVTIAIDCPECGQGEIGLPGHHLRSIRDALIGFCDRYPELVGGTPVQKTQEEFSVKHPGGDPSLN